MHSHPGGSVSATAGGSGQADQGPYHCLHGFWCEALAPQHPWVVRLGIEPDGAGEMADLFVREITEGMEDPGGGRGERFTNIRAGAIKIGTSALMRPSEKAVHIAAAMASRRTGCPITTHTTNGGGLEQARLLLESGVVPGRVIIGHQGHMDDGKNAEAGDYHQEIARLGCYLQFDRVGAGNYGCDKQARLIHNLVAGGFERQILVSHDHVPYFYGGVFGGNQGQPGLEGESGRLHHRDRQAGGLAGATRRFPRPDSNHPGRKPPQGSGVLAGAPALACGSFKEKRSIVNEDEPRMDTNEHE